MSILLYGAPSWAGSMLLVPRNKSTINGVQRKVLLRSICRYHMVSETASNILSGVPPVDLLAEERSATFSEKRSGTRSQFPPPRRYNEGKMRFTKMRITEAKTGY